MWSASFTVENKPSPSLRRLLAKIKPSAWCRGVEMLPLPGLRHRYLQGSGLMLRAQLHLSQHLIHLLVAGRSNVSPGSPLALVTQEFLSRADALHLINASSL